MPFSGRHTGCFWEDCADRRHDGAIYGCEQTMVLEKTWPMAGFVGESFGFGGIVDRECEGQHPALGICLQQAENRS